MFPFSRRDLRPHFSLPSPGEFVPIVANELTRERGINPGLNRRASNLRNGFPVGGNLRPVLCPQIIELLLLMSDAVRFPIENKTFSRVRIEQRKIDDATAEKIFCAASFQRLISRHPFSSSSGAYDANLPVTVEYSAASTVICVMIVRAFQ